MSTSKNFEVFSFNTAKSPQANTERQHYLNSIKIVDFKSGSSTTFIDSLLNAIQTGTLESLEEVMSLVANFKESGDYISDLNTMNTDNNNILDVFEYLNSLTEFPDDLIDRICETMGLAMLSDINRTEYVQKWDSLWNNLIVNIFSPTSFKFRMGLLHAIQAFKIVMSLFQEKVQTINEIQKLLKSVVIVPNGLLPIHVDRLDPGDNSGQNLNEIHIGWKTKIDLIQSAIKEIRTNQKKYRNLAHEVNTNLDWEIDSEGRPIINPEDLPSVIDFLYLSPERFTELNDITKDFLVDMGIDSSISNKYDDLIFTLSEESNNLYQKVFNPSYASKKGVLEGGAFFSLDDIYSQTSDPAEIGGPIINPYKPCKVAPLGISDYRRVEAIWSRYEPGEIAHIENLLDGEYKDRETRHLRSMEETYTVETIKEKEVIRDLQTTERFALQKEASKIVQNDFEAKLDTYVKGNYGTVNFGVSGGLSFSQSSSNSEMEASQYAREVIDRSVNRLIERTREERTIRIVEEFEEKNTHKLDNINGGQHKVGVFRWVDKIMKCTLANYGKRLLFEFMVPEPAAFHIFAKARKSIKGVFVEKPIHPRIGITNPFGAGTITLSHAHELDMSNYKVWASAYGATVEPYPEDLVIGKAYNTNGGANTVSSSDNGLKIPEGYYANTAIVIIGREGSLLSSNSYIQVGNQWFGKGGWGSWIITQSMNQMTDVLPVSWNIYYENMLSFNVEVNCKATNSKISEWQLKTFKSIMDAYQRKLDEFNNAVSEAQVSQGVFIDGNNPLLNREIERTELRKWCIQLMTENEFFFQFDAMKHEKEQYPDYDNYPYFDNCEAIKEGHVVKFIESILDWHLMSYFLYPYFYGNRNRWVEIYNTSSNDPLHTSFLQAGFARVVVPVRLGFEKVAMQFVETGIINYETATWVANSDEAIDASIELEQNALAQDPPQPGAAGYADWEASDLNPANWPNWEVRLPTNLVILQEGTGGAIPSGTVLPINPNA